MNYSTQLLGISNAIVDILAHVNPGFIDSIGASVGAMNLIDEARAESIYQAMGPATEMSGGSVANTVAGFATLGGQAAYIGHVHDDQLGAIFNHDMRSLGVDIRLQPANDGKATARSYILITPDAQRTMNTYLGSCTELAVDDITDETVGRPRVILLEGYVWDIAEGPALARKAMDMAAASGATVALSLSDALCVERHRESFRDAVQNGAHIVIADENEINALMECPSFGETMDEIAQYDNLFVMTRSAQGSVIAEGEHCVVQAALPVAKLVDTTGAGDAYSAGFLFGWANDWTLEECARLGTHCATQVIQQIGARIPPGLLESFQSAGTSQ
jgi:sugar/nucleoside kinase (ribokinase family)